MSSMTTLPETPRCHKYQSDARNLGLCLRNPRTNPKRTPHVDETGVCVEIAFQGFRRGYLRTNSKRMKYCQSHTGRTFLHRYHTRRLTTQTTKKPLLKWAFNILHPRRTLYVTFRDKLMKRREYTKRRSVSFKRVEQSSDFSWDDSKSTRSRRRYG